MHSVSFVVARAPPIELEECGGSNSQVETVPIAFAGVTVASLHLGNVDTTIVIDIVCSGADVHR